MAMMEHIALADATIDQHVNDAINIPHLEQLGDYRVLREVGRGGMGVVYEAEQVSLGRHVALKVLPPQLLRDPKQRRRFEREAKAAAKLHHTNIVPVFGVGEQEETPYYVMQFIQGQGLDAVLDELKRLHAAPERNANPEDFQAKGTVTEKPSERVLSAADVAQSLLTGGFDQTVEFLDKTSERPAVLPAKEGSSDALSSSSLSLPGGTSPRKSKRQTYWEGVARIGHQVADALAYAHAQGIVHRDIKPSNLLLDTKGTVWVADFGLAKASDQQDLTHTGDLLGTLRYMPPEAFGGKTDRRGDIYSLGLTLYEMLAFRPAFDESDRGLLVKKVTTEEPPRLRKIKSEIPRDLETIVQKAIERDPDHRYASASELADDLRRFVDDEPILARRASMAEQVARWGRRNPAVAALSAAVAMLLFAVIGGLIYGNESSKSALKLQTKLRTQAEQEKQNAMLAMKRESEQKAVVLAEKQKTEDANKALLSTQAAVRSALYAAQMNLTKVAWDSGNASRALDLLGAAVPKPGEPDLRGFEWNYWRRQIHGQRTIRKLPGWSTTTNGILAEVFFSPDGSLLALVDLRPDTNGFRKLVIQETTTGRLVADFPLKLIENPSTSTRGRVHASFSSDNKVLASCLTNSQTPYGAILRDVEFKVETFAWTLADHRELFHDSQVHNATTVMPRVYLNRDGSRIAIAPTTLRRTDTGSTGYNGSLRVIDVEQGREIFRAEPPGTLFFFTEFSPDGKLVATRRDRFDIQKIGAFGADSRLMIFEVETGLLRFDPEGIKTEGTGVVHFSPDGQKLAALCGYSGRENSLAFFDVATERPLVKTSIAETYGAITDFTFSPDGRSLYLPSRTKPSAEVRDVETGRLIQTLNLGVSGTRNVVVRRSDGRLLTANGDNLCEWDLPKSNPTSFDDGFTVKTMAPGYSSTLERYAVFAGGGSQLVLLHRTRGLLGKAEQFTVHELASGQTVGQFPIRGGNDSSEKVYWPQPDPKGTKLVALIQQLPEIDQTDTRVRVWDLVAGREIFTLDRERLGASPGTGSNISPQIWDPTGTFLAVGVRNIDRGTDGKPIVLSNSALVILEVPSGRVVRRIPTGSSLPSAAFSPDGKMLAICTTVAGLDGRVIKIDLVDPGSGRLLRQLRGDLSYVGRLLFSPDSRYLVAARFASLESSRTVIWDLANGAETPAVRFGGLGDASYLLAFSPNGQRLATASLDVGMYGRGEVKLWETSTGLDLATWSISKDDIQDLAFNPTGTQLRVASIKSGVEGEAGVTLLDASPLAPEIEADDLVTSLSRQIPLNAELFARIESDPELDPVIRTAALPMVKIRYQSPYDLRIKAASWLDLPATERTPELLRRALAHAEEAARMETAGSRTTLAVLAEARYRNGKYAEAIEVVNKVKEMRDDETLNDRETLGKVEAILAMCQARLGHAAEARAALANAKRSSTETNTNASKPSLLLQEAYSVIAQVKGTENANADSPPASRTPNR